MYCSSSDDSDHMCDENVNPIKNGFPKLGIPGLEHLLWKYNVDIALKSFRNPFLKHTQYSNKNVFQLNIIPSIIILNDNQLKSKIVKGKCSPFYDNFS